MRILLVEDDEAYRDVLTRVLRKRGFEVEEAADVVAAGRVQATPDVVISDWRLPDNKTAVDVQQLWPDVPLIVLSGYELVPGFVGTWLVKPIGSDELVEKLDRLLLRGRQA